jgi:HAD superfamily hydrolase (TIGR01459 family)
MICANPDIQVRWGGRLVWCAGALAEIYESLGGRVLYAGKPHAAIYELALLRIAEFRGASPEKSRVLAIGDGLSTDIAGANAQGFAAIYVAGPGGVHQGEASEDAIAESLAREGATAIAVMERLKW